MQKATGPGKSKPASQQKTYSIANVAKAGLKGVKKWGKNAATNAPTKILSGISTFMMGGGKAGVTKAGKSIAAQGSKSGNPVNALIF